MSPFAHIDVLMSNKLDPPFITKDYSRLQSQVYFILRNALRASTAVQICVISRIIFSYSIMFYIRLRIKLSLVKFLVIRPIGVYLGITD